MAGPTPTLLESDLPKGWVHGLQVWNHDHEFCCYTDGEYTVRVERDYKWVDYSDPDDEIYRIGTHGYGVHYANAVALYLMNHKEKCKYGLRHRDPEDHPLLRDL